MVVTPHRDVDAVEAALAARAEERAVVVTDSVFSADGALAPLRALHDVCRRHGALLIVDEAHGLGVRGAGGRGLLHEVGLAGAPDVVMTTTLSKALGSQGGVVLGPAAVRDHLIDAARPFIFDTGLAPAAVGAAWAALRVLIAEPWRAHAVLAHAAALAEICGVAEQPESAVVSVILGEPEVAFAAAIACLDRGVRVGCFRPPTVPAGHVAAAADGARIAVRRRTRVGPRGCSRKCCRRRPRPVSILVVTGTEPASARRWPPRRWPVSARLAGIDVAVCKPVQTGTSPRRRRPRRVGAAGRGDRALSDVALSRSRWHPRRPRSVPGWRCRRVPSCSAAPRRRPPGQLTLVEGAGGLLVELGADGVTLRDLARDLAAPVLVVVSPGSRHAEPHRADLGSACRARIFRARD